MHPPRTSKRARPLGTNPNVKPPTPPTYSPPLPASQPSAPRGRPRVRSHFALGLPVDNPSTWDAMHQMMPKKHVKGPRVSIGAVLSLAAVLLFVFVLWRGAGDGRVGASWEAATVGAVLPDGDHDQGGVGVDVDVGAEEGMVRDGVEEQGGNAGVLSGVGRVGYERSWPAPGEQDWTMLKAVERHLGFTNHTLLNYFHMHKTGGVTTKVSVMLVVNDWENRKLLTKRGERIKVNETCYQMEARKEGDKSIEGMWRCDWAKILKMTAAERDGLDIVLGHQYWEKGCDSIFGAKRTVKHFSIFRHPLPRKLSFFYHFFIRNLGRDEQQVGKQEVIRFLVGEDMPDNPRSRDAGPNYYASRLLSDGTSGFERHQYKIQKEDEDEAIKRAWDRLDHRFAFMGLQIHPDASQCMLKKTIEVLAHAHGIDNLKGTWRLAEGGSRLNAGAYPWTARGIWEAMSEGQRRRFEEVEKVDLAIYERAVEMFKRDVVAFNCGHKVRAEAWDEDKFE